MQEALRRDTVKSAYVVKHVSSREVNYSIKSRQGYVFSIHFFGGEGILSVGGKNIKSRKQVQYQLICLIYSLNDILK